jgi:NAD(P)-dependent dehydrogenase (short-subunit alcohol dehydrogenase family)
MCDPIHVTLPRSVKQFADAFTAKGLPLHLLINNAGVFCPPFACTEEGFEVSSTILVLMLDKLISENGNHTGLPGPNLGPSGR